MPCRPDTTAETKPTEPPDNSEDKASATEKAIEKARENNPELGEFDVLGVVVANGWARVDMQPANKSTDAASWLLKKEGGEWTLVDFGTSIMPEDHPDAPPEVFEVSTPE